MPKISVRLEGKLVEKLQHWRNYGFSMSDTVRQGLALLPSSPVDLQRPTPSFNIKPIQKGQIQVETKNERDALRALQEW